MKATIRGTIQPPRGTPGANGAYTVDLTIEIPDEELEPWSAALVWERLQQAATPKPKTIKSAERR